MDFSQPLPFIIESFEKDISNEEYHSHGSEIISSSFVKGVCKGGSVGHALKPFEGNTKALEFGTAFHDYMEHNGALPEDKYVKCDLDQRTKAYKELKAANQDAIFLKSEDFDALHQMYENTQANEAYQSLFQFGKPVREWSVFGSLFDIRCRVRFDLGFSNGVSSIENLTAAVDYKTCKSLQDFEADLTRSVKWGAGWMYHVQAVFYSDMLGVDPLNFYFVAVEKEFPYATQVYALTENAIIDAREKLHTAFDKIKIWKETGETGAVKHEIVRI